MRAFFFLHWQCLAVCFFLYSASGFRWHCGPIERTECPRIFEFWGLFFYSFLSFFIDFRVIFEGVGTPGLARHPQGVQRRFFMDFGWISGGPGEALRHPGAHFSALWCSRGACEGKKVVKKGGARSSSVPETFLGAQRDAPGPPECG